MTDFEKMAAELQFNLAMNDVKDTKRLDVCPVCKSLQAEIAERDKALAEAKAMLVHVANSDIGPKYRQQISDWLAAEGKND